jgi:hypothetical protein
MDPKLEKLLDEVKAKEAGGKLWLEKHLTWIVGALCFLMGMMVEHLRHLG